MYISVVHCVAIKEDDGDFFLEDMVTFCFFHFYTTLKVYLLLG